MCTAESIKQFSCLPLELSHWQCPSPGFPILTNFLEFLPAHFYIANRVIFLEHKFEDVFF